MAHDQPHAYPPAPARPPNAPAPEAAARDAAAPPAGGRAAGNAAGGVAEDPGAYGFRIGMTVRGVRERARAVFHEQPPRAFRDFPALLRAVLPDDAEGEAHIARATGLSVAALRALRDGAAPGVAGTPPEVLARLARLVPLTFDALALLVSGDPSVPLESSLHGRALSRAWAETPRGLLLYPPVDEPPGD